MKMTSSKYIDVIVRFTAKIKRIIFMSAILGILTSGCDEENVEIDPREAILGKWECVEVGNWPAMTPYPVDGYEEFSPDSFSRWYDYAEERYTTKIKYWVDDSLLYYSYAVEGTDNLIIKLKYQFSDNYNKLRLDYYNLLAINNTFILKRK